MTLKKRGSQPETKVQAPPQNARSVVQIFLASPWPIILSLIFGGCCSNVFTLEALVSEQADSGHLLTFTQFVFVAIEGYIYFFDSKRPRGLFIAQRNVPLTSWLLPVSLFFAVSLLNNYVWVYHISVPVHIIFRSGGTVATMTAGMLVGKRYTIKQTLSVIVLTAGVIIATLASSPSGKSTTEGTALQFTMGVSMLAVAAILSSVQGLVSEKIYRSYGKHWRESLFYTHALGLPFFLLFRRDIARQLAQVLSSEPITLGVVAPPRRLVLLLLNAFTQYICVRGVNNLAGNSTALTVSIVLNVRKFVSLLLSIYLFGNSLSPMTVLGTVLVFAGAGLYSQASAVKLKV